MLRRTQEMKFVLGLPLVNCSRDVSLLGAMFTTEPRPAPSLQSKCGPPKSQRNEKKTSLSSKGRKPRISFNSIRKALSHLYTETTLVRMFPRRKENPPRRNLIRGELAVKPIRVPSVQTRSAHVRFHIPGLPSIAAIPWFWNLRPSKQLMLCTYFTATDLPSHRIP